VLRITDDGIGMSPSVVQRAFDPFFTTKPLEHGTGLGLATVHAIVTAADGTISIDSQPSVGTSVTMRLPSVDTTNAQM
jgi:signal transduction histidine kinase